MSRGKKKILIENNEHESRLVYATEGEVWTLNISATYLDLIVDWNDFVNKKTVVKCYHIEYEKIDVRIK